METIKLPIFDGNIREYPQFKTDVAKQVMLTTPIFFVHA